SATNAYASLLTSDRVIDLCYAPATGGPLTPIVSRVSDYDLEIIETSLPVDHAYTRSVNVTLPIGVSGEFYFFVRTDASNQLNEFAFDNNNDNYDMLPTTVNLTPPPDLEVTEVMVPPAAQAGRTFTLSYSAINAGATRTP